MIKRLLRITVIAVIVFIGFSYNGGIPVEELKEKYQYEDSKFIDINGTNVHYRKTGSGPALLLIHGVSSSLHTWEGWHKELSNDFTVISIDVPGFGLTGPLVSENYVVEEYMNTFDTILDSLNVEKCYVAGNSFGGFLTWNYALHNPERVEKIVLLDAACAETRLDENLISTIIKEPKRIGIAAFSVPILKDIAAVITPKIAVKSSTKGVYGDPSLVTPELIDRYYELLLRDGNRNAFGSIMNMMVKYENNKERQREITQPTLILWGEKDAIIPVSDAKIFDENIQNSKTIIYPTLGHVPMEENPTLTANDVRLFLLDK